MSENLHDIDKLFRDGIESHEEMPEEKLWEGIDASLDKSNVVDIRRKYNNLKRVAALLLLMLLSVVGYEIFKTKNTDKETTVTKNNTPAIVNDNIGGPKKTTTSNAVNNGQVNAVNNAGHDSLSSLFNKEISDNTKTALPEETAVPDITKTTNGVNHNNFNKITAGDKEQKNRLPATDADNTDDVYGRNSVNKNSHHRTKVKVKAPQQYGDDNSAGDDSYKSSVIAVPPTDGLLKPEQNGKALSLATRIKKDLAAQVAALQPQFPEPIITVTKARKNLSISIMPFYATQFISNKIKEDKKTPGGGQGPGGPPPPRPGNSGHKDQFKQEEQSQTAYSAGIIAEVSVGKNWGLQTGVNYLQRTSTIEPKKIYARPDKDGKVKYVFDCTSGYSYIASKTSTVLATGDSINVAASKNTQGYIGVPVALSYKIAVSNKLHIIPAAGVVFNFLTKQKIKTQLVQGNIKEQQTISDINGLSKKYVNATAGLALEYDISKRLAFNIMPSGNFSLSSINNSDAAVKSYPNAFAVSAGLKVKL
jgi:hypothetical protein